MNHRSYSRSSAGARRYFLLPAFLLLALACEAQYRADHIPGFVGLQSGTQAPPGLYVGNLLYVYPTSTVKDDSGNSITLPGSLTMTADAILVSAVSDFKILGAHLGGNIAFPFIEDRIQANSLDVNTGFAYTDMFGGVSLGWNLKRADITAGYNIYIPTGRFNQGATDNTGLGMWANEFTIGSTVYLDKKRMWNAAALFSLEFNTDKKGTNIDVGDVGTVEGGLGRTFYKKTNGPIPIIMNQGAAGYAQWKVTGDSGSDIPPVIQGLKDRVFALGPEFNIFLPAPRLSFLVRYEPEFGARNRTEGHTLVFSIIWVAKSLVKHQP